MRRGAAPQLVLLAGGVAPVFCALPFCTSTFYLLRPHLFAPLPFSILPPCLARTPPPHAPTRTHELSRVPMGSHLTPIAQIQPASLALTHPKIEKNENFRASGYKTGHAVASRCYIR